MRNTIQTSKRFVAAILAVIALLVHGGPAAAQDFPTRNITIVVPLAAGSGMDSVVRIYAEELAKALGKPVVVENQPGAALMLAAQNVARATPDGHTLVVASAPVMAVNPTLYKKVNYDAEKDFVPLALYAKSPFVLIATPSLGIKSLQEFIKTAQGGTSPLTYATTGAGTLQFLTMEILKRDHKFQVTHVPYRSPPQIVNDVVGGHVASAVSETGAALSLILDGKIQGLGISSSARLASLPQVPTIAESLGMPGFEAVSWHVLMAPSATPRPVVDRLHAEMRRITGDAAFQKRVTEIGLVPLPPTPIDEIQKYIRGERDRWGGVVTALGLAGSL